jgi:hypothetical protein
MSVTFKKSWDQTFFQSFPSERDSYILKGQNIILSFAEAVADDGAFPDFKDALDITKDNILRAQILLKNETLDAFVIITKLIQEAHRVATPAVEEYLEPMYEQCGDARGKSSLINHCQIELMIFEARVITPETRPPIKRS